MFIITQVEELETKNLVDRELTLTTSILQSSIVYIKIKKGNKLAERSPWIQCSGFCSCGLVGLVGNKPSILELV